MEISFITIGFLQRRKEINLSKKIAELMLYLLLTSLIIIPIKFDLTAAYNGNEVNWDVINWILIDTDANEPGGENWRDVIAAYVSHDAKYLT